MLREVLVVVYGLLTCWLVLFSESFLSFLVLFAGLFLLWRTSILFSHGISSCSSCQFKLLGAGIVFVTVLVFSRVEVAYFFVFYLWLDFVAKDKHQGGVVSFY
ncbi:MAG: hypothetical protein ACMXYD_03000 [Candidatus Woesearchaeota archaeon]